MAVKALRWANGGADLHIIAGNPFELGDVLEVTFTDSTPARLWSDLDHRPSDVVVAFTTGAVPFTRAIQGVAVQRDDEFLTGGFAAGHVFSDAGPAVRNFIVTATITGITQDPLFLRVFLHDQLLEARLSPPGLHVPADTNAQFSVLGVFSDGVDGRVAADLSRHPVLSWAVTSGNTTDVVINSSSGRLTIADPLTNLNQPAQVQVTLPESLYPVGQVPPLASRQFAGTVTPTESWDRVTVAEPVGRTLAQTFNDVPNILLLPDGFVGKAGQDEFNRACDLLAGHLGSYHSTRPYDLLLGSNSLNIFKAWVSSSERGGTVLNELSRNGASGARVPVPIAPAAGQSPTIKTVENLIWQVGLPTKTAAARAFDDQRNDWVKFFGFTDPSSAALQRLWRVWKKLYPRYLAVEKDTIFGYAYGKRPQVSTTLSQRDFLFNERRTQRVDIGVFLAGLILKGQEAVTPSQRIGAQWASGGKDRNLIVFLANAPLSAGMRTGGSAGVVASSLASFRDTRLLAAPPADGALVDTDAPSVPADELHPKITARTAHEVGHALGLGDEYAEKGLVLPANPNEAEWGNLHTQDDLVLQPGGPIDATRIRWGLRWKRLRAAAVLDSLPQTTQPFSYVIQLRPGQGEFFKDVKANERLLLRRRPLINGPTDRESTGFLFQTRNGDRIEATGDGVVDQFISNLRTNNARPSTVVLIAPLLDDAGSDMGLMHDRIRQHIDTTNAPLNRAQGTACSIDDSDVQPSPNVPADLLGLPSRPLAARYLARIIGLYDGGDRYGCGVYHPQATCLMRASHPVEFTDAGVLFAPVNPGVLTHFCHVCRYLLVDRLNPTLHKTIDDDYRLQYPRFP